MRDPPKSRTLFSGMMRKECSPQVHQREYYSKELEKETKKFGEDAENSAVRVTCSPLSCYRSSRASPVFGQMTDQTPPGFPASTSFSDLYGGGYFRGQNSGYPPEGYAVSHPDWAPWLDAIQLLKPAGVLIDLGCAFGYLVGEARRRGYLAFGLDVSHFALQQEGAFRPWLLEASASRLPLQDNCADIITLFDLLEHLPDPANCLAEVRRVLRRDGLLVGATPDPIFFTRKEMTHFSENPPSFWVRALHDLGFDVRFRFSNEAYNFQFVATPSDGGLALRLGVLQHDYFGEQPPDILRVEQQGATVRLLAVPRIGWGGLTPEGRKIAAFPASVYLLNGSRQPLTLRLEILLRHTAGFSTLRVRLSSYVISEVSLDSEQTERVIHVGGLIVPEGGHHLFFDLFPGGPAVTVASIKMEAEPASRTALVGGLPFDLFQRYQLSSEIIQRLEPATILDIGGYLGDESGHLAVSHDFLQVQGSRRPEVKVTDVRQCDHPDYMKASALRQPFDDQSFDLVLSLDVLEHLPGDTRTAFLAELDRVSRHWILLGAPFSSAEIEQAEAQLADSLMGARRFLQEHRELGLPALAPIQNFFLSRGYTVITFPNGYLPSWLYWQVTTQHYFALHDYEVTRQYNSLYGRISYPSDNREPAYRHILLVAKSGLQPAVRSELTRLSSTSLPDDAPLVNLALDSSFLALHERIVALLERQRKSLTDVQFLINARQKLIDLLRRELETPLWRQALRRLRSRFR